MSKINLNGYYVLTFYRGSIIDAAGPLTKKTMNDYISERDKGTYHIIKGEHCYEVEVKTDVREENWTESVEAT